jgi:drug/metabolite transporter, DME family
VAAVGFALASAFLFGAVSVALRFSLRRCPDGELGALACAVVALGTCLVTTLIRADWHGNIVPFLLMGLIAPGASQLFYVLAVRDLGAARTGVVVGVAPLVSVTIALTVLGEPVRAPLVIGAVVIVLGGLALVGERVRPETFRSVGVLFALACMTLFATRDNLVRREFRDAVVAPQLGALATLVSGTGLLVAYLTVRRGRALPAGLRRALVPYAVPGVLFGLSYAALFEAFARGRVTIVSPLVAVESLFSVLLASLLLRRSELVSRHVVVGALLVVAGGALIGAFR